MPAHNTQALRYSATAHQPIQHLVVLKVENSDLCVLWNSEGKRIGAVELKRGEAGLVAASLGLAEVVDLVDELEGEHEAESTDDCIACALTAGGICPDHAARQDSTRHSVARLTRLRLG